MKGENYRENSIGANAENPQDATSKWLVFALCATAFFLAYFHRVSSAVIASDLKEEFDVSASALGLLSSMYFYAYSGLQIPVGMAADRISPRKIIVCGLLIATLGALVFGLSGSFTLALVGRILTGAGVATIYIPSLKLLSEVFGNKRFATATGLLVAVGNFGALSASTPFALLVSWLGWRQSFFVIASATVVVAFLCWRFLPGNGKNLRERGAIRGTEDAVSVPYRGKATLGKEASSFGGVAVMWLLGAIMFLRYGPLMGYQGLWGIPYLSEIFGMSKVSASNIVMAVSIGYMLGGPMIGRLNDKYCMQPKSLMIATNLLFTVTWIPLAFMTKSAPSWLLYICGLAMGIMSGGAGVIGYSLARLLSTPGTEATGMGIVNACSLAGGAVFQPLMGTIIDKADSIGMDSVGAYSLAFKSALASSFIMFLLTLIIKKPKAENSAA